MNASIWSLRGWMVVLFLGVTNSASMADNDIWKTAVSGSWGAGPNWLDGSSPDSIFDSATFNQPGAYTVSFSSDPDAIGGLTLTNSANVTFASSIRPGNPIVPRTLQLVETSGGPGTLIVSSGASLTLGATSGQVPFTSSDPFHLNTGESISLSGGGTLNARFGSRIDAPVISAGVELQGGQGTMAVSSGAVVTSNQGRIGLDSSGVVTVSGIGSRWNMAGPLFIGVTEFTEPREGNGTLSITGGGIVENFNSFVSGAAITPSTVTVSGEGSLWKLNGGLLVDPGTVQIQTGGTVRVQQETTLFGSQSRLRLQGGTFDTGELSIFSGAQFEWTSGTYHVGTHHGDLTFANGTFAPGHSAGSSAVLGNYAQQSAGILEIEIGGAAQATQYDFVHVQGNAVLGGNLDLKRISGFVPTPSQVFTILSANAIGGAFNNVANGGRLTTAGGGSFQVHYGAGSAFDPTLVTLSAFQATLPADLNLDGFVDGLDLGILLGNFNQSATPTGGELNGTPPVDGLDLGILLGAWSPPPTPVTAAINVPESASIVLFGFAAAQILIQCQRRGNATIR